MKIERWIQIDGKNVPVTISDEREALLAADAAGRAIIGIWAPGSDSTAVPGCLYLAEDPADVTDDLLVRAASRKFRIPLTIAGTPRLRIREFSDADPLEEPSCWDCGVFSDREKRHAYIENQYRFAECGLWALVLREGGEIIGKAGITGRELGYHIYPSFRGNGYALEACRAILEYADAVMGLDEVLLRVADENSASRALAQKLGFVQEAGKDGSGEREWRKRLRRG